MDWLVNYMGDEKNNKKFGNLSLLTLPCPFSVRYHVPLIKLS